MDATYGGENWIKVHKKRKKNGLRYSGGKTAWFYFTFYDKGWIYFTLNSNSSDLVESKGNSRRRWGWLFANHPLSGNIEAKGPGKLGMRVW